MRVILMVMDSVGIGALPDADSYNDNGSDTVGNIIKELGNLRIDNMVNLGMANIDNVNIPYIIENPRGCYGKAKELSVGKDTTTGHWEISGLVMHKPFPVYPNGFPKNLIHKIEKSIGRKTIGNKPASGTKIIEELGFKHIKTGMPIVYTSADSVFQVACHEEIIPLEELYDICKKARELLTGEHAVGRVIARPFKGEVGSFYRTEYRKDYSLSPQNDTMLDLLVKNGYQTVAVGKIEDIFANRGITVSKHTHSNDEGVKETIDFIKDDFDGLIFTNLVDFDMLYGHRNDIQGYADALEQFDTQIPSIINELKEDDVLIITADHGCDPTTASTDHSREYIPILIYGKKIKQGVNIGIRDSYSDIAKSILEMFDIDNELHGSSFYGLIKK